MLYWNNDFKKAIISLKNNFPHLLFKGKNEEELNRILLELLQCLNRTLQDSDLMIHDCENNGGISAVRDILRPFTRGPRHTRPTLILLKRFDRLSHDAQFALRRTMEIEQDKCRCIATCTSLTNVIQPILSRFIVIAPPFEGISNIHYNLLNPNCDLHIIKQLTNIGLTKAECLVNQGINLAKILNVLVSTNDNKPTFSNRLIAKAYTLSIKNAEESLLLFLFGQLLQNYNKSNTYTTIA